MKRLPKYTPAEVRNDPYGFTYKEMSEVIGENEGIKYVMNKSPQKIFAKAVILKSMFTN